MDLTNIVKGKSLKTADLSDLVQELDPDQIYKFGPISGNGYSHYFPFDESGWCGRQWIWTFGHAHAQGYGPDAFKGMKLYPNPYGGFHLLPKTGLPCLFGEFDEHGKALGPTFVPIPGTALTEDFMRRCSEACSLLKGEFACRT